MSVPPGTEMFQFPGFASPHYGFMQRYPKGVGCPIRTSTDQRLLAAPRGFSQRATSFIASWCQGIHRMPFFRARSPCTGTIFRISCQSSVFSCQRQPNLAINQARGCSRDGSLSHNTHTHTSPLNSAAAERHGLPRPSGQTCDRWRPETHQNLIHPDKDHTAAHPTGARPSSAFPHRSVQLSAFSAQRSAARGAPASAVPSGH